jgi:hypothetical protein
VIELYEDPMNTNITSKANAGSPEAVWEPISTGGERTAMIYTGLAFQTWAKIPAR